MAGAAPQKWLNDTFEVLLIRVNLKEVRLKIKDGRMELFSKIKILSVYYFRSSFSLYSYFLSYLFL